MEERNKKAEALQKEKEEAKLREEAKIAEKVDLKAKRKISEVEPEDNQEEKIEVGLKK